MGRAFCKMEVEETEEATPNNIGPSDELEDDDDVFKRKEENSREDPAGLTLSKFLSNELTRGYFLEHAGAKYREKRERVYAFMKIPWGVEQLMIYGLMLCTDAFLFIFTFLPLRVFLAIFHLISRPCSLRRQRILEPAQICDLLKAAILLACSYMLLYVDVSRLYHLVRGQAIIKLYIIYNMLEVADRLFSAFGQDILDALFWTATEPKNHKRDHIGILPHLLLAIFYVFFHSVLVLVQATTLNVAFNSFNKALLTVMMSNNFVELKGSVFKKFEKNNLYQMACSDVRERFHYWILLFMVILRNMTEFSWNLDHLWELVPDMVMVLIFEVLVDWVKHAFITRFNEIPSEVYKEYCFSLSHDMASTRQKDAFSDPIDVVSRRMGFIPLPLACLIVRIVTLSVTLPQGTNGVLICILCYLCLVTFKVANNIVLLGWGWDYIQQEAREREAARLEAELAAKKSGMHTRSYSMSTLNRTSHANHQTPASPDDDLNFEQPKKKNMVHASSCLNLTLGEKKVRESGVDASLTTPNPDLGDHPHVSKRRDTKPLSEVDRYTLCSNRIV